MIQPEDILQKARNIYPEFVQAWLSGDPEFFPRIIPAQRDPGDSIASAIQLVSKLREGSKEVLGFGFTVEWREIRSRKLGRNLFPERIFFAGEQDLLRFIRKEREFAALVTAVEKLRAGFPELDGWVRKNVRTLLTVSEDLEGLMEVVRYLRDHPRPKCFARELPVPVDTKFVGRHRPILRAWLDIVLPPHSIRADEDHFERRFGLRYVEPDLSFRCLDPTLQEELQFPCPAISVPLHTASSWAPQGVSVIIVENRVNLLTLPALRRTLALGGMGNAVPLLRYLPWLADMTLTYWGDIDVESFEILSRARTLYPHTRSVMMDETTIARFRDLMGAGSGRSALGAPPPHLTAEEQRAFTICAEGNLRLEQERIPHADIPAYLSPRHEYLAD